jgi:AAA ATPase domain
VAAETKIEKRAWELLTHDFYWEPPADFGVMVYRKTKAPAAPAKLQIFEVAVAAIFSRLRPEYKWCVTPNLPDGGSDFIGRQQFLKDEALGIAAAITVGGQCKKRGTVGNIVNEISGSLVNMVATLNPTFFVVALSARLTESRIEKGRARLEEVLRRDCHILARSQIEGMFNDHLSVLEEILHAGLPDDDQISDVLDYLDTRPKSRPRSVTVLAPTKVLAGVPFSVTIKVRSPTPSTSRLWWKPDDAAAEENTSITLISPVGADAPTGAVLPSNDETDDPIQARCLLELVSYSVGEVDLGKVQVGDHGERPATAEWTSLGSVRVIENLRPRFYERPFRIALSRLDQQYERALAGGAASIGVVGAGGSGKSRLSEEFGLKQRRQGIGVVAAKQAKTLDDPHRVLADFFLDLLVETPSLDDPANRVIRTIEGYDSALARRAEPAIRSIFGSEDGGVKATTEQDLLSALLLLVAARGLRAPLIVHLQDLHWCSADVLLLLEKLVWQLGRVFAAARPPERSPESGVLFIFEGRVRERQRLGEDGWDSEPFEALLQKLDCPSVTCSFDPEQGLEFIRRLFEDRHNAQRQVNTDMLGLQRQLIQRIHRAAGGNPFHSLEQVQFLKEKRIIGQNPATGLLYLIQPVLGDTLLPDSVFEAIRHRWMYMKSSTPELALLVWAASLLEDRLPTLLFRRLWTGLAPEISLHDVDTTEMLWTGEGEEDEVSFRHENYFRSVRRFEVSPRDRERVVELYCGWFAEAKQSGRPADRYRWALALLQLPVPDTAQAEKLMRVALRDAQRQGDIRLARRISAAALDLTWTGGAQSPARINTFLRRCEEDLALTQQLLATDRSRAARRLDRLREKLRGRLSSGRIRSQQAIRELRRLELMVEVRHSQILFNDRQPEKAGELAAEAVHNIQALRLGDGFSDTPWEELEMEALHSEAVALAISGEIEESLETSAQAVAIARRLSSPLARHVVSTYANILLSRDPRRSESILRQCLAEHSDSTGATEAVDATKINLGIALVVRAHRLDTSNGREPSEMLAEAGKILKEVFTGAFQLGRYPDAGAAALMLGIVSIMREDHDEVSWFAQAVAASARGSQIETLWRAHINLATAMYRREAPATGSVRDHALAMVEILDETLSPYPEPDRSPRFELVRVLLAQAVRLLQAAGDKAAIEVLERYPALRSDIEAPEPSPAGGKPGDQWRHEWWLHLGDDPYVLY